MKNKLLLLLVMLIGLGVMAQGCKKDDNPAAPAGPTGSFSFATDSGNFSVSGSYNANAASGSGAGWYTANIIMAYSITSPTSVSVVLLSFASAPSVGTRQFPTNVAMAWSLNANPADTASAAARACAATSGVVNITAHGGGTTQGTLSGLGLFVRNPSHTFNITNGTFNINSGTGKRAMTLPEDVNRIVRMMRERMDQ